MIEEGKSRGMENEKGDQADPDFSFNPENDAQDAF